MEKSYIKKTSSMDFLNKLKNFSETLWTERNTASVELGAIIEEFEGDIKAETNYREKCRDSALEKIKKNSQDYGAEIVNLEFQRDSLLNHVEKLEEEMHQYKKQVAELKAEIYSKNEEYSKLRILIAGEKESLGEDYSLKVTQLYEEVSKKNKTLLDKWVKKNESLKAEIAEMKGEYEEKLKVLNEKEEKLESDFNIQSEKLNSKIKVMMKNYEDRLKHLDEKEKAMKNNFDSQKKELVKTFDRVKRDFEEREKKLRARESQKQ